MQVAAKLGVRTQTLERRRNVFEPARTFALILALNFKRILTDFSMMPGLEESPMHCAYSLSTRSQIYEDLKTTIWGRSRARCPSEH